MREIPILKGCQPDQLPVMVEIVRCFSFKLNVGNYESRDFFCSQKASCSINEAEKVSAELHKFCQEQVQKAVAVYQKVLTHRKEAAEKSQRKAG